MISKERLYWLTFALFLNIVAFSNAAKMERVSHEVDTAATR